MQSLSLNWRNDCTQKTKSSGSLEFLFRLTLTVHGSSLTHVSVSLKLQSNLSWRTPLNNDLLPIQDPWKGYHLYDLPFQYDYLFIGTTFGLFLWWSLKTSLIVFDFFLSKTSLFISSQNVTGSFYRSYFFKQINNHVN